MKMLKQEIIEISANEEFMLDPEQSTSAIIHHPGAKYLNVE